MRESPRIRRLKNDFRSMESLARESTILSFEATGNPADHYVIRFAGRGIWRPEGTQDILLRDTHEVTIELGASYPRMMPDLAWKSPIFHPNISGSGVVCLGGYGTHWVPSLTLPELCEMLWDMIRFHNFDVESPYNREAAYWAKTQSVYSFPLDGRPIRNRVSGDTAEVTGPKPPRQAAEDGIEILGDVQIVEAELVDPGEQDILFLD